MYLKQMRYVNSGFVLRNEKWRSQAIILTLQYDAFG